jgi:microcystin-dependent protein
MAYTKKNPMLNKGDAVYGEHFNNSALLAGMFSMIGQVNIPYQFEAGLFNTTETPEKALFLRITLEKLTGTNNNDSIILDTGQSFTLNTKVVLSLFKSWKRLTITGTNVDVEIGLYTENDNLIRTVNNNQELTNFNITDESIKVVITAKNSCTISNILFEVTTKKWDNNSTVTIPQEQITGLKEWETAKDTEIKNIANTIYPVGAIYLSTTEVNPSSLFGGNWERIKDKFLLASGDTYANGATGGSATHTLTQSEMPIHTHTQNSHNHTQNSHTHTQNSHNHQIRDSTSSTGGKRVSSSSIDRALTGGGSYNYVFVNAGDNLIYASNVTPTNNNTTATNVATTATNKDTGEGQAHNNMPPYLAVYMWKRIG